MYKAIIRPLLFLLQPETVHHLIVSLIKVFFVIPGIKPLVRSAYRVRDPGLEREVFGLKFENPVGLAAGFDKNATFFNQFSAFGFSFIEVGTVTPVGQPGNPKPRSFRLTKDKALINRMGLNNDGVKAAAIRLRKRRSNVIIGGNLGKNTATPNDKAVDDYAAVFEELYEVADYFVVNVSCPNISDLSHLQDRDQLDGILSRLSTIRSEKAIRKPVLVKISPDLNNKQIDDVIDLTGQHGMDGIIATNTTITRDGLSTESGKVKEIGNGGLSGSPVRDRSTEIIRYIHEKTAGKLPIIGVGGIMNPEDAIEKIKAGASLVQVYTGFIYEGPSLVRRINRKILRSS
ncbi:MAG TPA: quinone-dependent dihydroorotate dehydrogenase [Bacteroides sp.]|nr:quinone-dependent dihydroorotate dehydrogenase [Bacteroides sp.]